MKIYTDGSNHHNGKPYSYGGYGWVIVHEGSHIEGGGSMPADPDKPVTNNRAELLAIIDSLEFLYENELNLICVDINIFSDSKLCVESANMRWKKKNNMDLWNQFNTIYHKLRKAGNRIQIKWVRGHNGNHYNEMADEIAGKFSASVKDSKNALEAF